MTKAIIGLVALAWSLGGCGAASGGHGTPASPLSPAQPPSPTPPPSQPSGGPVTIGGVGGGTGAAGILDQQSSVAYESQSTASPSDVATLAGNETAASWKVYGKLVAQQPTANLAISPVSLDAALALLYPGAGGTTASQMASALGFDADQAAFAPKMAGLLQGLASAGSGVPSGSTFQLTIENDLWLQKGLTAQPTYLDTVKRYYDAAVNGVDFAGAPDTARQTINTAVAAATQQKITNLLPQGSVTTDTTLILTNSVYLLSDWAQPFEVSATQASSFTGLDGTSSQVQMMSQQTNFPYTETSTYQAVELPYVGGKLAMLVVLPKAAATDFAAFESAFDPADVATILGGASSTLVDLSLPKFTMQWGPTSLATPLQALGMTTAFTNDADFSGVLVNPPNGGIHVSDVLQETYVKVDEKGTQAAAATAVTTVEDAAAVAQPKPTVVDVNHPALFFICDVTSHATLFMGRLVAPSAQ